MLTQHPLPSQFCECGRRLVNLSSRPVNSVCICGRPYDLPANPDPPTKTENPTWIGSVTTCTHRGPHIGTASCGCGGIYLCELLGGYCGDREVVEFATIGEDVLTRENYRRCSGCTEFSDRPR